MLDSPTLTVEQSLDMLHRIALYLRYLAKVKAVLVARPDLERHLRWLGKGEPLPVPYFDDPALPGAALALVAEGLADPDAFDIAISHLEQLRTAGAPSPEGS